MTSKPHRMHPISLLIFIYESIKEIAFPLIIIFIGVSKVFPMVWIVSIIAVLALFVILLDFLDYWMFTYQILEDEIIIKSGVFVKKVNHVPYDRIQNITANQWFFLKPLGLEELEIETAGQSEKAEVELKAVSASLKDEINHLRRRTVITPKKSKLAENSYMISWRDLLKFSLTSPTYFAALMAASAMYGKIKDVINKDLYQSMTSRMAHLSLLIMIVFILLMLFILYLVSAVVLISKYYKFQLTEHNGQLQMTRGLFQTKKTSISIKRIQAVIVKQPLLRGFLKIATIQLVVVSNSGEKDIEKDIVIMPVIAVSQVERFLQQFLPQIPVKTTRFKPFAYAYYYELRNATLLAIPTLAFLAWVVRSNFWFVIIVIIFGLFFWYLPAFLKARQSKVQPLNKEFIILQNNRIMTKQVNYIARSNIQYIEKRSSLWLQRKGIASLLIYVRSGNGQHIFNVTYQSDKDISTIVNWYKAKTSYNNIDQII